jgi:hypothetical protein
MTLTNNVSAVSATNSLRLLDLLQDNALPARDRAVGEKTNTPTVSGAQAPRISPLVAQKPNTPSPTPLTFAPVVYTAIGSQRPLSALGNATSGTLLNAVKAKVPGSAPLISALQNILPKGRQTGADLLRLEMNTLVSDKSSVVHVKFNLAQLAKGPSDKVFSTLLDVARTPTQKAQVIAAKQMFDAHRRKPAFAQSNFAKNTDLRVTFDVPGTSGFRVGTMTLPHVKSSKNGWVAVTAVSPRLKFDANGKLAGGQLIVAVEVDTPDTKRAGMWAGIGAGGIAQWDGNASKSPICQDARGNLGVEFKVGKAVKFLKVPYLSEALRGAGMAKAENFRVSHAPAISSEVFARDVLHTNDPKVIKSLKDGAELAEKTGDVVGTATEVVGTVSQLATAATVVAQVVGLPAALLSGPAFFALPQDRVADATPSGMFKTKYYQDVEQSVHDLKTINFMLKRTSSPLFPAERSRLNAAVHSFTATARHYHRDEKARSAVGAYVPAHQRFPHFTEKAVIEVENAVRARYPDFKFLPAPSVPPHKEVPRVTPLPTVQRRKEVPRVTPLPTVRPR